jgi:DMSO/TMAO reductase YedYZ molybdopterin-dependent catalytic subunit
MSGSGRPALAGGLAVAASAAAAELVAEVVGRPQAGTLFAVGGLLVDAAPTPVKEFAVATLGTADKPVLLAGVGLVLAVLACLLGIVGYRVRWAGLAGAALLGLVGVAAALSRPAATLVDAVPTLVGTVVIGAALLVLLRPLGFAGSRLRRPHRARQEAVSTIGSAIPFDDPVSARRDADDAGQPRAGVDRRAFLARAAVVAAGAAAAGGGAALLGSAATGAQIRQAVRLPAPVEQAPPLPPGLAPDFLTSNADFYRVDTALTLPRVDLDTWKLSITGRVDSAVELSFAELLARPLVERVVTLNCVSNEVGGPYIGTARWLGVPLAPLLREAGIQDGADQLIARSIDGMTIGTPVAALLDGREPLLCMGMNGEPLPLEHGFPVRMLTPGLYGYVGACKWLRELELTTFAAADAYWVERGWSPRGPVKTASRIDTPAPFARLSPGHSAVAGVAWAQGRGITAVEVQVDAEPWRRAALLPVPSIDTWVQWRYDWDAPPGSHTLRVRATDGTGAVQPEQRVTPFPDGATGWHTITAMVG